MAVVSAYQPTARAYADGVQMLLSAKAPLPLPIIGSARHATALARRAEALAPVSAELRRAASAGLAAATVIERERAVTRLLTHAVTELQISAYLLQATPPRPATMRRVDARSLVTAFDIHESLLGILEEEAPAHAARALTLPVDLTSARRALPTLAASTLGLIQTRAAKTGQTALSGLLLLGLEPVSQAAGLIGADVAQALGIAEKTSRLYAMIREFAVSAYNTLVALLGPALAQTAAQQALAWINDVAAGQQFAKVLARLYGTEKTLDDLSVVNLQSQAGLPKYLEAMRDLDGIGTTFQEQIGLVEKLLYGFRLVSTAAVAALPQATLLMAVAYLAILAYTVLAGADYADAQRVKIFNRVPGVRQIVETQLKGVVS